MSLHKDVHHLSEEDGDRGSVVRLDAPVGFPGEAAPEITLAEGEGREGKKSNSRQLFEGWLLQFRGVFGRKAKPDHKVARVKGLDCERSNTVDDGGVEEGSEEGEASDGGIDGAGEAKAGVKKKVGGHVLLGGVAAAAVVVVVARLALWPSSPRQRVIAEPGMSQQPLLAPAASLASAPKPEIGPSPELPSKSVDGLREIMSLKQPDVPAAPPNGGPKPGDEKAALDDGAHKPIAAPTVAEKPNSDLPEKVAAKPAVEAPHAEGAAEAGVVEAKPGDLGAGVRSQNVTVKEPPASQQDRVEALRAETALLERVTQLAALVAHLNDQVNRLQSGQAKLSSRTDERFADLERRMALAESGNQLDAASKAQDARHSQSLTTANPTEARLATRVVLKTGPASASIAAIGEKKSYRIQAASPSLAMLGTGDNGPPLEITPGSTVPGWGLVSKIEQRGQTWVVVTAGGVIQ